MVSLGTLLKNLTWEAYGQPLLAASGLYEQRDRSNGRSDIPFSPMERRLFASGQVDVWFGKVILANGKDWCWYQVWEKKHAPRPADGTARPDILFVHGTGVHSGTLAGHARRYLDAGFRLIVPDLVSHGYSSGLHVYQRQMRAYTEGLHAVLHDVARRDATEEQDTSTPSRFEHQQTFLLGLSFGGTVALHYTVDYPDSVRGSEGVAQGEIPIDGVVVVGPILGYSTSNIAMPKYLAYTILGLDAIGAGCLELVVPHKKCLDKDPKVYKSLIDEDKRSHQGAFRVGHMLCLNDAVVNLHGRAHEIRHPIFIQQGGQDRVACPQKTVKWIQRVSSIDKRMAVYPVCQHVIFRKAATEEEDLAGRVACIEDNVAWMLARSAFAQRGRAARTGKGVRSAGLSLNLRRPYQSPSPSSRSASELHRLRPPFSAQNSSDSQSDTEGTTLSSGYSTPSMSDRSTETDLTDDSVDDAEPYTPISFDSFSGPQLEQADAEPFLPLTSFSNPFVRIKAEDETYDHPLLSRAHSTTLPALAKLCPERIYRPYWLQADALCPFDVNVCPEWSEEEREAAHREASLLDPWSSFS